MSKLLKDQIKPIKKKKDTRYRLNKYRFQNKKDWTSGFKTENEPRNKRSPAIKVSDSYRLNSNKEQMTPMGSFAKMILETIKAEKKADLPSWQKTITKLQNLDKKRRKFKKELDDESEETMGSMTIRGMRVSI